MRTVTFLSCFLALQVTMGERLRPKDPIIIDPQPPIIINPPQPPVIINPPQPPVIIDPQPPVIINPPQPPVIVNPPQPPVIINPPQPPVVVEPKPEPKPQIIVVNVPQAKIQTIPVPFPQPVVQPAQDKLVIVKTTTTQTTGGAGQGQSGTIYYPGYQQQTQGQVTVNNGGQAKVTDNKNRIQGDLILKPSGKNPSLIRQTEFTQNGSVTLNSNLQPRLVEGGQIVGKDLPKVDLIYTVGDQKWMSCDDKYAKQIAAMRSECTGYQQQFLLQQQRCQMAIDKQSMHESLIKQLDAENKAWKSKYEQLLAFIQSYQLQGAPVVIESQKPVVGSPN